MSLAGVRIVLVEPAGPLNVGAIARVMKNLGLSHLVLVNPQCDYLGPEALQMAVHAADILQSAKVVGTLTEALKGITRAIATTGLVRTLQTKLEPPRQALPWLLEEPLLPAALIFGREDRGLTNQELNYSQRFVRIPTSPDYPSMNLATAVAICCYELAQINAEILSNSQQPDSQPNQQVDLASLDMMEGYYQQLEALLLKIGYLYPHTAASRMEKFRYLFNRAQLQNSELAMLRGILSQIEWALVNLKRPE
ncbi:MAG: RNA methyltransferase [Nostocaceae cyanobacterium]|nr:RNA methyltransferase [Nostocaceae cyanobacterium]